MPKKGDVKQPLRLVSPSGEESKVLPYPSMQALQVAAMECARIACSNMSTLNENLLGGKLNPSQYAKAMQEAEGVIEHCMKQWANNDPDGFPEKALIFFRDQLGLPVSLTFRAKVAAAEEARKQVSPDAKIIEHGHLKP